MDKSVISARFGGGLAPQLGRVTRRDCLRAAVDLATEVAIIWSFLKAYNVVRDRFGSTAVSPQLAAAHALQVWTCCSRLLRHRSSLSAAS
jgi:hypothetical protein